MPFGAWFGLFLFWPEIIAVVVKGKVDIKRLPVDFNESNEGAQDHFWR